MAKNTNKAASQTTTTQTTTTQAESQVAAQQRANRVAVSATETGFRAEFWRTHKRVLAVASEETGWVANPKQNRSAQREDFRVWVCENSADLGVVWSPEDQRTDENKRIAKYATDEDLTADTLALVSSDISQFVSSSPWDLTIGDIGVDGITPMVVSAKGTDLSKLGILDGKYEKNGNWAWATIGICTTIKMGNEEIYVTVESQLVSGQLKKPGKVGDGGWTQTAWNKAIETELRTAGILKEEK